MKMKIKFFFCSILLSFICINTSFAQQGWFWQNPLPQGNVLFDLEIINKNTVLGVGGPYTVVKTSDNGETWKVNNSNTYPPMNSVCLVDTLQGWAAGFEGELIRTTDSGETWINLESGTDKDLFSIYFIDESIGWLAGQNGTIRKTTEN